MQRFTLIGLGLLLVGCHITDDHQPEPMQWTIVAASTSRTVEAARAVLEAERLQNVHSNSTNLDGHVEGHMATGNTINVWIKKQTASSCRLALSHMDDEIIAADVIRQIKTKAESP